MHGAVAWCKRGDINQMIKLAAYRFQGIAGRSNVQHRMKKVKFPILTIGPQSGCLL
jgi:hypothetical protein